MGCFLACFGSSKDHKHCKRRHKVQPPVHQRNTSYNPLQQSTVLVSSVEQEYSEKPVITVSEVGVKAEEQLSSGARKKVTFDSNVKTYERVLPEEEVADNLPEASGDGKKEKEESAAKSNQSQSSSEASSVTSSGSYPPNHRYQNCRESDDEDELDYEDSDLDDDDDDNDEDDGGGLNYDDVCEDDNGGIVESRIAGGKVDSKEVDSSMVTSGFKEEGVNPVMVNRAARDRSAYVHSVLNPVENLTQWKALKARGKLQLKQQKENSTVDQEPQHASFSLEPSFQELSLSFKSKSDKLSKKANQEIAVDTSLSNWLASSETTPINKSSNSASLNTTPGKVNSQGSSNSVRSQEDRPILGALTLEEIKQFSASNSPRKSPSRSPEEMPIIGTVGTYWSPTSSSAKDSSSASSCKGIPNTTSKYREDKKVNWHSTPFETRLERALNKGAAETYYTHHTRL